MLSAPVEPRVPLQGPDAFPDVTFSKFKLSGILISSLVLADGVPDGGPREDEDAEDVEDPRPLLPPGE